MTWYRWRDSLSTHIADMPPGIKNDEPFVSNQLFLQGKGNELEGTEKALDVTYLDTLYALQPLRSIDLVPVPLGLLC